MVPSRRDPEDQVEAEIVHLVLQRQLRAVEDSLDPIGFKTRLRDVLEGVLDHLLHLIFVVDVHPLDADGEQAVLGVRIIP